MSIGLQVKFSMELEIDSEHILNFFINLLNAVILTLVSLALCL